MSYAIIRAGGKQQKVSEGDLVVVEKIEGEPGDEVTLGEVLALHGGGDAPATIGAPLVDGASVTAQIVKQYRAPKIHVFKMKRRKGYRRRYGHRQYLTQVKITGISG